MVTSRGGGGRVPQLHAAYSQWQSVWACKQKHSLEIGLFEGCDKLCQITFTGQSLEAVTVKGLRISVPKAVWMRAYTVCVTWLLKGGTSFWQWSYLGELFCKYEPEVLCSSYICSVQCCDRCHLEIAKGSFMLQKHLWIMQEIWASVNLVCFLRQHFRQRFKFLVRAAFQLSIFSRPCYSSRGVDLLPLCFQDIYYAWCTSTWEYKIHLWLLTVSLYTCRSTLQGHCKYMMLFWWI